MLGRETFIVRVAEDAMAPRVRVGDYVWVDPDEPAADGRLVAVRDRTPCVTASNPSASSSFACVFSLSGRPGRSPGNTSPDPSLEPVALKLREAARRLRAGLD